MATPINIDYYLAPASPWAFLGHERFMKLVDDVGANVSVRPADWTGAVFPVSGGVPLEQRSAQRQAYRLLELRRFSEYFGIRINVQPRHFPVDGSLASRLLIAVDFHDGSHAALHLCGILMRSVWVDERNIADEEVLADVLSECCIERTRLSQADHPEVAERYRLNAELANRAGVFGAPSYVLDGEVFWGQDRLEFLDRALRARLATSSQASLLVS